MLVMTLFVRVSFPAGARCGPSGPARRKRKTLAYRNAAFETQRFIRETQRNANETQISIRKRKRNAKQRATRRYADTKRKRTETQQRVPHCRSARHVLCGSVSVASSQLVHCSAVRTSNVHSSPNAQPTARARPASPLLQQFKRPAGPLMHQFKSPRLVH